MKTITAMPREALEQMDTDELDLLKHDLEYAGITLDEDLKVLVNSRNVIEKKLKELQNHRQLLKDDINEILEVKLAKR
jgi:hypothetical protein